MSAAPGFVRSERHGAVELLRLDDGRLNVLRSDGLRALREALAAARASREVRAVALLGRKDAFCAGLDLKVIGAGGRAARELFLATGELLHDLYAMDRPLVVGCTGHAVAAGAMLLLVADLRIGAEGRFRIGFSEVARGLPLPELPLVLARERLSPAFLQQATVLGRLFAPGQAVSAGFLDRVEPAEAIEKATLEEANALAKLDAEAYARSVEALRRDALQKLHELLERARRGLADA